MMRGRVVVMEMSDFQQWLTHEDRQPLIDEASARSGEQLLRQYACLDCHEQKGSGPLLAGLYGSTSTLSDGSRVLIDEQYLRRALLSPDLDVPLGYAPSTMPTYATQIDEGLRPRMVVIEQ